MSAAATERSDVMTRQEQVLEVLAKVCKKEQAAIQPEHELAADLGIDSPKGLQLLAELEDRLKIEISDEDAARMNTVNDILTFVKDKT
jgi:acyl carrier protein